LSYDHGIQPIQITLLYSTQYVTQACLKLKWNQREILTQDNKFIWMGNQSGVTTVALLIKLFVLMNNLNQLPNSMKRMSPGERCQFYGPIAIF
jgi:hypothetical protein